MGKNTKKKKKKQGYNNIAKRAPISVLNPLNVKINKEFLRHKDLQGLAKSSLDIYTNDVHHIAGAIYEILDNQSYLELSKKDWESISYYWKDEWNQSSATINKRQAVMRGIGSFLEDDDEYDYTNNTTSRLKSIKKTTVRDMIFLTNEQIFGLAKVLKERKEYQKLLYLFLSYDSAGRANEVFQVQKECLLNAIQHPNQNYTNNVVGKRNKTFKLTFFTETIKSAKLYFDNRGEDNVKELWVTKDKDGEIKPLANKEVFNKYCIYFWSILDELKLVNIDEYNTELYPHCFRHSCLDNLFEMNGNHYALTTPLLNRPNGLNVTELAILANHNSIETTQSYLKNRDEEIKLKLLSTDDEVIIDFDE